MFLTGGPGRKRWERHAAADCHHFGACVGIADDRSRGSRDHAGHRRQIADVAVDHAEEGDDGGLASGDAVKIGHDRS